MVNWLGRYAIKRMFVREVLGGPMRPWRAQGQGHPHLATGWLAAYARGEPSSRFGVARGGGKTTVWRLLWHRHSAAYPQKTAGHGSLETQLSTPLAEFETWASAYRPRWGSGTRRKGVASPGMVV